MGYRKSVSKKVDSLIRDKDISAKKNKKKKHLIIFIPLSMIMVAIIAFLIYAGQYYHAEDIAIASLQSDSYVHVSETDYGWFFDGPSEENVLVFYPGAKVEETAYAPLLHNLAENNIDVCLVKMPLRFAFFGINKAESVMEKYEYDHYFLGGHSLGGAMSAEYASRHSDKVDGVILFASYAAGKLDESMTEIVIYGTEDKVVNRSKIEEGRNTATNQYYEYLIEGGNHAQFGNYGIQSGDGTALISAAEQQSEAVRLVIESFNDKKSVEEGE